MTASAAGLVTLPRHDGRRRLPSGDQPRARDAGPDQAVPRRPGRRRRSRPGVPRRRGLRLPRAQRLGQDHHHPDAARPGRGRRPASSTLLGRPIRGGAARVLPRVGALVEGPAFHPYLSGRDNLPGWTRPTARPTRRTARAARSTRRSSGSGWPRPRASGTATTRSACGSGSASPAALLRPRELLVLDEPTNGLDPQGTREVRSLVRELAAEGVTVFLSTHLLSEVEQICTHVGVMSLGRLVAQGTLRRSARRGRRAGAGGDRRSRSAAAEVLARLGLADVRARPDGVIAELGEVPPRQVVGRAGRTPASPCASSWWSAPDLEDVFVGADRGGLRCRRVSTTAIGRAAARRWPRRRRGGRILWRCGSSAPSCGWSSAGAATSRWSAVLGAARSCIGVAVQARALQRR